MFSPEEAEEPWSEFFEEAAPAAETQAGEEAAPFTVREGEAERAAASESSFQAGQETEGLEGTDEAAQEDDEKEESQIREEFEEWEAFVDSKETSMSERTEDAEARREELALAVTAGMNEEEKKIFEDETLGLTLEEKLAYRKMSRGKRRVLKKIAETRRRKAELRLENERRAVAAMEKLEKLRESARSHENYKNENGAVRTGVRLRKSKRTEEKVNKIKKIFSKIASWACTLLLIFSMIAALGALFLRNPRQNKFYRQVRRREDSHAEHGAYYTDGRLYPRGKGGREGAANGRDHYFLFERSFHFGTIKHTPHPFVLGKRQYRHQRGQQSPSGRL